VSGLASSRRISAPQAAPEHRTQNEPDRRDHRVGPHRQAQLVLRERVGDQRCGIGEQEGRADPLQDAPQDQDGGVGGEAGSERGQGEDQKAAHVGALASEQVAEAAGHQHQHGGRDQVSEDDPHERQ